MSWVHILLYEIDWGAISTIVLTAITGYYAWSTRQILGATARQANAAEENVRLLLLERTGRVEQFVAPVRNVVAEGLALAKQWAELIAAADASPSDLSALEPDGFFDCVALARSISFNLHDKLRHVQGRIVDVRVAYDTAQTHRGSTQGDELRKLSAAVESLRLAWECVADELDRRTRA
jgi:hypothetical protein